MDGNSQLFSDNPQSFSVSQSRSELFTSKVWQLRVGDLLKPLRIYAPAELTGVISGTLQIQMADGSPTNLPLTFLSRPCHLGGVRWLVDCPECRSLVYTLYWRNGKIGCRKCQHLRYVSKTWSKPYALMNHYGDLTERLQKRPGPKPKRYLRYVMREDQYCRLYIKDLEKWGEKVHRRLGR